MIDLFGSSSIILGLSQDDMDTLLLFSRFWTPCTAIANAFSFGRLRSSTRSFSTYTIAIPIWTLFGESQTFQIHIVAMTLIF